MSGAAAKKPEEIKVIDLGQALSERYLAYALSTITARSLPDVRDGLKPVQRRLLYAMLQLRLDPAGGFKKCARVVGDVIGKFHPHGDVAVYEALVRLAQDFAQRYPLVDGQGNFGNVDGDNAAAMRYTESRLTPVAMALLDGIDEDAVDFRATYDGSEQRAGRPPGGLPEPAGQRCGRHRRRHGDLDPAAQCGRAADGPHLDGRPPARRSRPPSAEELLKHVKGPDLPTGGVILDGEATLLEAYATGRGAFRLRAHYEVERLAHGQYQVIVDRDAVPGAEGPPDRADGRAPGAEEAAAPGRRARRIGRDHPPRPHPALAGHRARGADGADVPRHRPGGAALAST